MSPLESLGLETGLELLCECGRSGCRETVRLSPAEVVAFRGTDRPIVAPGHQPAAAQPAHEPRPTRKTTPARVLAVDDSETFLSVADSVVSSSAGLCLVGTAASGEEAIRLLADLRPDLVLLDVHMPGIDGFETARIIRDESPEAVVVIVSADPDGLEADAASAGAVAILGKVDLSPDALGELWLEHGPGDRT